MKIILHSNATNLSDFTNGVYFLYRIKKNIFIQKISLLASRWSQLQLNVVYNIQRKRKIYKHTIFKYILNESIKIT